MRRFDLILDVLIVAEELPRGRLRDQLVDHAIRALLVPSASLQPVRLLLLVAHELGHLDTDVHEFLQRRIENEYKP